jgi:hypothetical protein
MTKKNNVPKIFYSSIIPSSIDRVWAESNFDLATTATEFDPCVATFEA